MMPLSEALRLLPGLVIGVTVHECAHAWSASRLGDDFSRRQGRVSLNPLRHLTPLGTLALFVLPFGWGRPVVVNLYNFKHPKRDYLLSSLAGPAANLLAVGCCICLMLLTRHSYAFGPGGYRALSAAHGFLLGVALINAVLAVLNLIPIPPLDGSKIWAMLIPGSRATSGKGLMKFSIVALLVLLLTNSLDPIITFGVRAVYGVLPVSDGQVVQERQESALRAYAQGRYAQAETLASDALRIHPASAESYHIRALARQGLENWEQALEDIDRALELEPHAPALLECRAVLLERMEREGQAAADRRQAETVPSSPPTRQDR